MDRRTFIATGLTAGAAAISNSAVKAGEAPSAKGKFKLKYGPPFGMFKNLAGDDHIDESEKVGNMSGFRQRRGYRTH